MGGLWSAGGPCPRSLLWPGAFNSASILGTNDWSLKTPPWRKESGSPRGQRGRLPRQSAPAGRSRAVLPAGLPLAWAAAHGTRQVSGSLLTAEDGSWPPFSLSLPDRDGVRAELLPVQQARGRGHCRGQSRGCPGVAKGDSSGSSYVPGVFHLSSRNLHTHRAPNPFTKLSLLRPGRG